MQCNGLQASPAGSMPSFLGVTRMDHQPGLARQAAPIRRQRPQPSRAAQVCIPAPVVGRAAARRITCAVLLGRAGGERSGTRDVLHLSGARSNAFLLSTRPITAPAPSARALTQAVARGPAPTARELELELLCRDLEQRLHASQQTVACLQQALLVKDAQLLGRSAGAMAATHPATQPAQALDQQHQLGQLEVCAVSWACRGVKTGGRVTCHRQAKAHSSVHTFARCRCIPAFPPLVAPFAPAPPIFEPGAVRRERSC